METNKKLIMIIDDVPKNIQVLANILDEQNYEIAFADNGHLALQILNNVKPDLILLDVMMPEMDGYELCTILKNSDDLKDIPIIFLTAKNDTDSIVKSFDIGAADYLTKPFNSSELLARVKTQLALSESKRKLKDINQLLEQKVNEKTIELRLANEKLNKLDKAKNYLLGLLSHELLTPITQIKSAISLLKLSNENDDEIIDFLENSVAWIEKIATISKLITALKAEKYEMKLTEFCLCNLLDEVLYNFSEKFNEKQIKIISNHNDNKLLVKADYYLLNLFFNFVIDNAIKFSKINGEIKIDINQNEKECIISIIDSGNGFTKEYLENQFEFFNSDNLLHHKQGLGLSLAASKMIFESHGGKLILGNIENNGAIVTAILPLN